ncbi:MAG: hypothetical protein K2X86_05050 [Cytophagaceae bacterium]|nr:hypothetical protein [Cytophagaceae bacterium]
MDKKIRFGKIENQEDEFLEYSKGLSVQDRLRYMTQLTRRAYGKVYEARLKEATSKEKKHVKIVSALPNESLSSFFKRAEEFKE